MNDMKVLSQVFISITAQQLFVHGIGISVSGGHDWIHEQSGNLEVTALNPLVKELERRGFEKQPSTGYLLIFAKYADDSALPAGQDWQDWQD